MDGNDPSASSALSTAETNATFARIQGAAQVLNGHRGEFDNHSIYEHSSVESAVLVRAARDAAYADAGSLDPQDAERVAGAVSSCMFYRFGNAPASQKQLDDSVARSFAQYLSRVQRIRIAKLTPKRPHASAEATSCAIGVELGTKTLVLRGTWSD